MKTRLQRFIAHDDGDFEALALELCAWQRAHSPAYDRFCGSARPERWQEIPAVPVPLFRDVAWTCFPPEQAQRLADKFTTDPNNRNAFDGSLQWEGWLRKLDRMGSVYRS